jgi:hypothetical protein
MANPILVWTYPTIYSAQLRALAAYDVRLVQYRVAWATPFESVCEQAWRQITTAAKCKHPDVLALNAPTWLWEGFIRWIKRETRSRTRICVPLLENRAWSGEWTQMRLVRGKLMRFMWRPDMRIEVAA